MDVSFLHQGQTFVWDSRKAAANLKKHEVAFEKACEVFFDPFLMLNDASVKGEARNSGFYRRLGFALRRARNR